MSFPQMHHGCPVSPAMAARMFYVDGRRQSGAVFDAINAACRLEGAYIAWAPELHGMLPWAVAYEAAVLPFAADLVARLDGEQRALVWSNPHLVVPDCHGEPGWFEQPLQNLIQANEERIAAEFMATATPILVLLDAQAATPQVARLTPNGTVAAHCTGHYPTHAAALAAVPELQREIQKP